MKAFNYSLYENTLWDSEIINLLAQIHEHKGKQELFIQQKPAVLDTLVEIAKIQSIACSSNPK